MKNFKSFFKQHKKLLAQIFACFTLVFLLFGLGRISAYFMSQTAEMKNTFPSGIVSCEIFETFNGIEKSNVRIKNTGNTEAYFRCFIVATWMNDKGEIYGGSIPIKGKDFNIEFGDSWTIGNDGYYYCAEIISKDEESPVLIEMCTEIDGKAPNGYHLSVEIIASAVQANPDKRAELWENYN